MLFLLSYLQHQLILFQTASVSVQAGSSGIARIKTESAETESDFSDLDSVLDTPKEAKLRRDLHQRIKVQKKQSLKIQSLRRKNLRLTKKIASLKQIIFMLKKRGTHIDNDTKTS